MYQTRLLSRTAITEGTLVLKVKKPQGFSFLPGQYSVLHLSEDEQNKDLARYLSMTNTPQDDELFFVVRKSNSLFKEQVASLPVGETMFLTEPDGELPVPADITATLVFIAGGIGVAPFRSIVKSLIESGDRRNIVLFYSARTLADAPFMNELRGLAATSERFSLYPTLTRNVGMLHDWSGMTSRLTRDALKSRLPDTASCRFHIAGTTSFVESMSEILCSIGAQPSAVVTERFCGFK